MADRKSIHLFDLDDTLVTTSAKVRVVDASGRRLRDLPPAEFTEYALSPGEVFDFTEFSDIGILSRGIVLKYTRDIIEQLVARKTRSRFGILTARGDKTLHSGFLIRLFRDLFGIKLEKSLIFAVSDQRFNRFKDKILSNQDRKFSSLSIPERKAWVVLDDLISRGFNDISFYDDSRQNLKAFRQLSANFPSIVFKSHFIDPTWTQRLKEFSAYWSTHADPRPKTLNRGLQSVALIWENHGQGLLPWEEVEPRLRAGESLDLPEWPLSLRFSAGLYQITGREKLSAPPIDAA